MLTKRIIPCLDCDLGIPEGRVVKGIEFKQIRYAGVPWELAKKYSNEGADELVLLDITATKEKRETMVNVVKKVAKEIFVPLTVGGGIRDIGDVRKLTYNGADAVSLNTAAVKDPDLISQVAEKFGSQACVVAIDAKRRYGEKEGMTIVKTAEGKCWYDYAICGGTEYTGKDAIKWAMEAERRRAGQILLDSIDRDGTKDGFDIELTKAVSDRVNIPVIAAGGCGSPEDMVKLFKETDTSAALAASIFHYDYYTVRGVKAYLKEKGINVRLG